MSFLDKNGLQVLTNKLVQGDAIKVASHRGHTVKNVIDNITRECENISTPNTMNLENRINEFKVGKGRDIDVSGDVEESKIEVELEGRTYQNLLKENTLFTKAGGSGIEKIIHSVEQAEFCTTSIGSMVFLKEAILKDNTTYTVIAQVKSSVKEPFSFSFKNNANYAQGNVYWHPPVLNEYCYKRIVLQTTTNCTHLVLGSHNNNLAKGTVLGVKNVILLEGDYTQTPTEELPKYFEGIKSSFEDGIVDVEVQGKNLISKATEWRLGVINADTGIYSDKPSGTRYTSNLIYNPSGKELYIRSKGHMWNYLYFYDENKNYLGFCTNQGMGSNYNFNINFDNSKRIAKYFIISFGNQDALEIGEVYEYQETDYITPYKKKISFNIGEPLRSLPNGISDEITDDGRLIRRVGKVVLDGSEDERFTYELVGANLEYGLFSYLGIPTQNSVGLLCDRFVAYPHSIYSMNKGGCYFVNNFKVKLLLTKLPSADVIGFKQWLSQNPTTVYYELAEPIITPIEPIEFEVKPLATMTINSEIAPTSNHKVVLNRAGQIERGIVQIAELKKRVDSLETAYDSYLLETQHKLSILGFEYELESEEI